MAGKILLLMAWVTSLAALGAYGVALAGQNKQLAWGRRAFQVMTLALAGASGVLVYLLFSHQFQYSYVYSYSSIDLPWYYLLSSFWAGQEGTFLLWAFLGGIIGLAVIRYEREEEAPVLAVLALVQSFLLTLTLVQDPFTQLPFNPGAGSGLNPLLQNPWMVIHPPIVFLGYAGLAVPFAFAIAALLRRNYGRWAVKALPWTLFAWLSLSVGIFIGSYWAYAVLGWGGYWAWDPVENASLVPWLTGAALLHGLLMQKYRKAMGWTSLLLAISTYLLVLYATYLTRSGILADFSVHSFQSLGTGTYLLGGLLFFTLPSLGLLLLRRRETGEDKAGDSVSSKEFAFFLTILLLAIAAGVVTLGTSAPALTRLIGNPAAVNSTFYNVTQLPIGILIGGLLGLCPVLQWRGTGWLSLRRSLTVPALASILAVGIALVGGVRRLAVLLLILTAVFALTANTLALAQTLRLNWRHGGGYLSHVGMGLLLLGIIVSANSSRTTVLELPLGQVGKAFGYELVYNGRHGTGVSGKEALHMTVTGRGGSFDATPAMGFDSQTMRQSREPDIHRLLLADLYISPVEVRAGRNPGEAFTLTRDEERAVGAYRIRFEKFAMESHAGTETVQVGAVLHVTKADGSQETVTPLLTSGPGGWQYTPARLSDGTSVSLESLNASLGQANLRLISAGQALPTLESLVVEVSYKPFMASLWLGAILLSLGTALAWRRRSGEARQLVDEAADRLKGRSRGRKLKPALVPPGSRRLE